MNGTVATCFAVFIAAYHLPPLRRCDGYLSPDMPHRPNSARVAARYKGVLQSDRSVRFTFSVVICVLTGLPTVFTYPGDASLVFLILAFMPKLPFQAIGFVLLLPSRVAIMVLQYLGFGRQGISRGGSHDDFVLICPCCCGQVLTRLITLTNS